MMRQFDVANSWCDETYDPWMHAPRDEPPELTDDDYCRSMYDPNLGWLDA